jgi:hypothetical protein
MLLSSLDRLFLAPSENSIFQAKLFPYVVETIGFCPRVDLRKFFFRKVEILKIVKMFGYRFSDIEGLGSTRTLREFIETGFEVFWYPYCYHVRLLDIHVYLNEIFGYCLDLFRLAIKKSSTYEDAHIIRISDILNRLMILNSAIAACFGGDNLKLISTQPAPR